MFVQGVRSGVSRPRNHRQSRVRSIALSARRARQRSEDARGRHLHVGRGRAHSLPPSDAAHFPLLDKPLSFDDPQERGAAQPLPLVLVGSAGSGKTALMLRRCARIPGASLTSPSRRGSPSSSRVSVRRPRLRPRGAGGGLPQLPASSSSQSRSRRAGPVTLTDFRAFFERHRA